MNWTNRLQTTHYTWLDEDNDTFQSLQGSQHS